MTLLMLILVPLLGGVLAWRAERRSPLLTRQLALVTLVLESLLLLGLLLLRDTGDFVTIDGTGPWWDELRWHWIPRFGISFHLALDGLSLLLVILTVLLGFMAISSSWNEIRQRQGLFYLNLLWTLAGVIGVFLALDLFLFFVFWEVMIVPMYFLISQWGHEQRAAAAIKFFLFTQVSGLLMLLAIVALVLVHHANSGVYTFDYFELLGVTLSPAAAFWLMLGFFFAFVVKLPGVPLHTWLPDAHTQAPTGGSVILAGILLKTGAYGLLRFVVPLFPEASRQFAPVAMTLGVISILYAAKLAFAQSDLKRLIAYTSISHMGFVLVGIYAWNLWALQGAVITMLAHGISAAALFMIAGALQERLHTREMSHMGGFWGLAPRLSAITLFFSVASLGLPGLGNFVGEFLVLLGAFQVSVPFTVLAALGLIAAPVYALIVVQRVLHGEPQPQHREQREPVPLVDFNPRELAAMGVLIVTTLWLGLFPQGALDLAEGALLSGQQEQPRIMEMRNER